MMKNDAALLGAVLCCESPFFVRRMSGLVSFVMVRVNERGHGSDVGPTLNC